MMRALWTAASGMTSQQMNVDTISNNLANVNTHGFKRERLEFKSLLYQTLQRANLDRANQTGTPVNLQVGLGVRPIATSRIFTSGSFERTDNPLDFAIEGQGFFVVRRRDGEYTYTRDGNFKLSLTESGELMLVTSEGFPILDVNDDEIFIPEDLQMSDISVSDSGDFFYTDEFGEIVDMGVTLQIVQFANPQGLEAIGSNLFATTPASGDPLVEYFGDTIRVSRVIQNVLEMSNVLVADEMVRMIIAQRAFELNSRAIQASDEMLQQANNLRRG